MLTTPEMCEWERATCNFLLSHYDIVLLQINLDHARETQEINPALFPILEDLFHNQIVEPIAQHSAHPEDLKLLRWILLTYGGADLWNKLTLEILRDLEVMVREIRTGTILDHSRAKFKNRYDFLGYHSLMLGELVKWNEMGGPLAPEEDEAKRKTVRRREKGAINFTKQMEFRNNMGPEWLREQVEKVLKMWQRTLEGEVESSMNYRTHPDPLESLWEPVDCVGSSHTITASQGSRHSRATGRESEEQ